MLKSRCYPYLFFVLFVLLTNCRDQVVTPDESKARLDSLTLASLQEGNGKLTTESAMNLLQQVAQSNTIWSMVYQMNARKLNAVIGRNFNQAISFELKNN